MSTTDCVGNSPLLTISSKNLLRNLPSRCLTSFSVPQQSLPKYVMAICESRGLSPQIGIAAFDLRTSECILAQFPDCPLYTNILYFLNIYIPQTIILCSSMSNSGSRGESSARIMDALEQIISLESIHQISRRYFNDSMGIQCFSEFAINESLGDLNSKYFSLSSFNALLKWLEEKNDVFFQKKSLHITFKTLDGCMFIDSQTAKNLELCSNLSSRTSKAHLLGAINFTSTSIGYRFLRLQILQPSIDLSTIYLRHACVEELLESKEKLIQIKTLLKSLLEIEPLISRLIHVTKTKPMNIDSKIVNVLAFKQISIICLQIGTFIEESFQNELLQTIGQSLCSPELSEMLAKVSTVINEECTYSKNQSKFRIAKYNCIRDGLYGILDRAKVSFAEMNQKASELCEQCSQDSRAPIKLCNSSKSGYFLQASTQAAKSLPRYAINLNIFKGRVKFTTMDLLKLNQRLHECCTEISVISDGVLNNLNADIKSNIRYLYSISGSIALLDFLISLAYYSISFPAMSKPEFTDTLAVKDSRHPILDSITERLIPNNIFCYESCNFQLITSPNMSGKSTYLKQIALLIILAQIGAWIPASYASIRLTDRIMSRSNNNDDIGSNSSTFLVEMREVAHILESHTPRSLILIDELGRGTCTKDAIGIIFAFCEKLCQKKAFVFFVTHFREVVEFLHVYPNVVNLTFDTEIKSNKLVFNYTMQKGVCSIPNYGISLAECTGFPAEIIQKAKEITGKIIHEQSEQRSLIGNKFLAEKNMKIQVSTYL
jgi:DNA mismatch repair protein MSH4